MRMGWQKRPLGELAELKARIGWRGLTAKEYTQTGPLFLSVHSLNYGDHVDFSEAFHISEARYAESPEIMLQKDDILICKDGAGIGKVGIVGELPDRATINSSLLLVRSGHSVLPQFLYRCLTSPYFQKIVLSRLNGATTPHLYQRDITEFPVVLPPLAEQQQIVDILEDAFEGIATAVSNAEQNFQNSRALFNSYLRSVFTEDSARWTKKKLGEIAEVQSGGTPTVSQKEYWDGEIPWYSSGELNDTFTTNPERSISKAGLMNSNAKLFPKGSLLVGMYDTAALKMSILDRDGAFNQAIAGVKPNDKIELEYVLYAINANKPQLLLERRGVRQKNLSLGKIKDIALPLPVLSHQRKIVFRLRSVMAETQRLCRAYEQKLVALEELKASLLHHAFSGELINHSTQSVVLSFPTKTPRITTKDLHAGILATAYDLHEKNNLQKHFGHVKAEKIAHMVEAHLGIDLGRTPIKDAAGPNDYPHQLAVEHRARKAGYFDFKRVEGAGYQVKKLRQFDTLVKRARVSLREKIQSVDELIELMLPMNTQQAEICATVYSAWNNLLLDGQKPTDEDIVFEARENWHKSKLNIPREKFFKAVEWLRDRNVVPSGGGKRVIAKSRK